MAADGAAFFKPVYPADKAAGGAADGSKELSALGAFFLFPWYFGAAIFTKKAEIGHLTVYRFGAAFLFRAAWARGAFASGFRGSAFCGFFRFRAFNGASALVCRVKTAALKNNAGSAVYQAAQFFAAFRAYF
jgi:hypothetical protein